MVFFCQTRCMQQARGCFYIYAQRCYIRRKKVLKYVTASHTQIGRKTSKGFHQTHLFQEMLNDCATLADF